MRKSLLSVAVRASALIATTVALALGFADTAPAATPAMPTAATAAVSVTMTFAPAKATPNTPILVTWSTLNAPSGSAVRLQLLTGSTWSSGVLLPTVSGHTAFRTPAKSGTYQYRVAVINSGKVLVASAKHSVLVTGKPPAIAFALSAYDVSAGVSDTAKYTLTSIPAGSNITLQRDGASSYWYNVTSLTLVASDARAFKVPQQGTYLYRIVATKFGITVAVSAALRLYSYANVTLAQLLHKGTNTVQVGGSLFRYAYRSAGSHRMLLFDATSCRSITLQVAMPTSNLSIASTRISVIQDIYDPYYLTVPFNKVISVTVPLTPDPFTVNTISSGLPYVYINGWLNCFTPDGNL
jgi:hypothetical protein